MAVHGWHGKKRKIKCKCCEIEFETIYVRQKFCSTQCKNKFFMREHHRKYRAKNPPTGRRHVEYRDYDYERYERIIYNWIKRNAIRLDVLSKVRENYRDWIEFLQRHNVSPDDAGKIIYQRIKKGKYNEILSKYFGDDSSTYLPGPSVRERAGRMSARPALSNARVLSGKKSAFCAS